MKRLLSRKLWMAIAGIAVGIATMLGVDGSDVGVVAGAVTSLGSVVAYIMAEGKIDAVRASGESNETH